MIAQVRVVADARTHDASDPEQIKKREAKAFDRDLKRKRVLATLLSTPEGRDWFWAKLSECNIFQTTFTAGDPYGTAFAEGRRSIGLSLLAELMRCAPETYVAMQREAHNDG